MNISEDFIISFTGNPSTVSNGKSLAAKGSFKELFISDDETLLFGSCAGSGKDPYVCSVDFIDNEKPIARCNCPSRQLPCKHAVGLLFCKLQKKEFKKKEVPEDIVSKRGKIEKKKDRAEKSGDDSEGSEAKSSVMTKAKATAAAKKCSAQIEGIELSEKILHNIISAGLHSFDKKNEKIYREQVKGLGSYYIDGIEASFYELFSEITEASKEQHYGSAIDSVNYIYALLKKSKAYLEAKKNDYLAFPEMTTTSLDAMLHSAIEEQIGYAWKLSELKERGLFKENAELLQVSFDSYDDSAKKQYVDEGCWIELESGNIYLTKNFRPYNALKYIKQEDSFFSLLTTSELSIYPGELNPRVRWERFDHRDVTKGDLAKAKKAGKTDFADLIKKIKAQIKNPLSDKNPIAAVVVSKAASGKDFLVIYDEKGTQIVLKPENFGFLIKKLSKEQIVGQTMICRFTQDMKTDLLYAVPMALVNDDGIIRFNY